MRVQESRHQAAPAGPAQAHRDRLAPWLCRAGPGVSGHWRHRVAGRHGSDAQRPAPRARRRVARLGGLAPGIRTDYRRRLRPGRLRRLACPAVGVRRRSPRDLAQGPGGAHRPGGQWPGLWGPRPVGLRVAGRVRGFRYPWAVTHAAAMATEASSASPTVMAGWSWTTRVRSRPSTMAPHASQARCGWKSWPQVLWTKWTGPLPTP